MHIPHMLQCTIQNSNVYISVLNGALWNMRQAHCGICELAQYFEKSLDKYIYHEDIMT